MLSSSGVLVVILAYCCFGTILAQLPLDNTIAQDAAQVQVLLDEIKIEGIKKFGAFSDYNPEKAKEAIRKTTFDDGTEASVNRPVLDYLFENDIVLTVPQAQDILEEIRNSDGPKRSGRQAQPGERYFWKDHRVAYTFSLNDGLWHEQSRYDRDDYVNVDFGFIFPGTQSNFAKRNTKNSDNLGQRYDLGSVMHYGAKAFSTDYSRNTIVTNDENYQYTIGQRLAVSFKDARMVNLRYCSDICKKELECKNGGYTNPNNCKQCKCPKGLGGTYCDKVAYSRLGGTYCDKVAYSPNGICNGRDLKATKEWSQFESPPLDEGLNCFWRVLASEGEAVEIEITYSSFPCKDACSSFVEVKYLADKTTTGARLCCDIPRKTIISEDNFILLWLRTDPELIHGYLGFKMRYRTVSLTATPSPVPTTTTTTTIKTTTTGRGDPEWSDWGKDIEIENCGQESCEKPKSKTTRCTGRLVLPCDLMDELDFGTTHSADPFQKPTIELLQTHKNAKTLKRVRREASKRSRRFIDGNKQMADGNFCEKRFTYNCPTSLLTINIDRKTNKDVSIEQCCPGWYKNQGRCVDGRA
uniref:Metalloendopeptidase n=1 Tax=Panagrolaimus sp. ES5 TaxID=591445 RepID=A0AC34FR98_9BILA